MESTGIVMEWRPGLPHLVRREPAAVAIGLVMFVCGVPQNPAASADAG